jgi:hypothetical protein
MDGSGEKDASTSRGSSSAVMEEPINVFLRLRPKNKLETMKRSKDCIELHENPNMITVDSPLLGDFKFLFDQVMRGLISFVFVLY